jgi:hypothetical protein
MLPTDSINEIRKLDGAAIAEISGRDSIAAVIRACEMRPDSGDSSYYYVYCHRIWLLGSSFLRVSDY